MFGRNVITAPFRDLDGDLKVTELFYTIQGEGPDAGRPAMFLRLTHCNLRCYFCDTEFEKGTHWAMHVLLAEIMHMSKQHMCSLLVITGGEPLLQNIVPLVSAVNAFGISVSVETAGTVFYDALEKHFSPLREINDNLIVCSPKTPRIHPGIEALAGAFKYIIKAGEVGVAGLPCGSTQRKGVSAQLTLPEGRIAPIYVQPCDEQDDERNELNLMAAVDVALKHGYRLSIQMHKIAGLR